MKPELIAALATGGFTLLNFFVTLRLRVAVLSMRQDILDRVAKDYQPIKVCEAKMEPVERALGV